MKPTAKQTDSHCQVMLKVLIYRWKTIVQQATLTMKIIEKLFS